MLLKGMPDFSQMAVLGERLAKHLDQADTFQSDLRQLLQLVVTQQAEILARLAALETSKNG